MSAWDNPSLPAVSIDHHHLAGYIDFTKHGYDSESSSSESIDETLSILSSKKIILTYNRPLLSHLSFRCFIYVPSTHFRTATVSADDNEPLSPLDHPMCNASFAARLRHVFDHLNSDWSNAWVGLSDSVSNETSTPTAQELCDLRTTQEAAARGAAKSRCGVMGCHDHPIIIDTSRYARWDQGW